MQPCPAGAVPSGFKGWLIVLSGFCGYYTPVLGACCKGLNLLRDCSVRRWFLLVALWAVAAAEVRERERGLPALERVYDLRRVGDAALKAAFKMLMCHLCIQLPQSFSPCLDFARKTLNRLLG